MNFWDNLKRQTRGIILSDNPITLGDLEKPINTGYDKVNKYGDDDWATPPKEDKEEKPKEEKEDD